MRLASRYEALTQGRAGLSAPGDNVRTHLRTKSARYPWVLGGKWPVPKDKSKQYQGDTDSAAFRSSRCCRQAASRFGTALPPRKLVLMADSEARMLVLPPTTPAPATVPL